METILPRTSHKDGNIVAKLQPTRKGLDDKKPSNPIYNGGAEGDRTPDPLNAIQLIIPSLTFPFLPIH